LDQTIPAMPVRDVTAAADFYRDRFGFEVVHLEGGFAVIRRDDAVVHLWEASDESWRDRGRDEEPISSGAESFIAGTASCRIRVEGIDQLFEELREREVLCL
jgi:catechol 2,3-dioxygenase-like lactoylglutathione lyase family enzyme